MQWEMSRGLEGRYNPAGGRNFNTQAYLIETIIDIFGTIVLADLSESSHAYFMAEKKQKKVTLQDSVRELIFKRRNFLGLSRDQLGYLTGYEQSSIRKIENGDRSPSLVATFRLLGALGLRPSTVMKQIEQEVGFEILPRTRIQEILDAERPSRRPKKHRNR